MPEYFIFVAIGVVLLLVFGIFLWHRKREAKRNAAFERLSLTLGFQYAGQAGLETIAGCAHFHLFAQGRRKRIRNLLRRGDGDSEKLFFDYELTTGGGQQSHTLRQSVALFRLDRELPTFELRPEQLFHKIGAAFGYQDIDFDSSAEFSRRYLLRGQDEAAIRSLFGPSVRHFLEQSLGWSIEGGGRWVIFYRWGRRIPPAELSHFLEATETALRTLVGR